MSSRAGLPAANSFNARRGATVSFFDVRTLSPTGEATVRSMRAVREASVLAQATRAMANVNAQCAGRWHLRHLSFLSTGSR